MSNEITNETNKLTLVESYYKNSLITKEDMQNLADAANFMYNTHETVPMYRPLIIKMFGVLSNKDFPTADSKYLQCKIEAETHSQELIRELHDLQLQKLQIEKAEFLLNDVMKPKYDNCNDIIGKKEIEFDMKEQSILLSRKKFEFSQMEKRIKYRISEITEWKKLSEDISKSKEFKNQNQNEILIDLFIRNYESKLLTVPKEELGSIKAQLDVLKSIKSDFDNKKSVKTQ